MTLHPRLRTERGWARRFGSVFFLLGVLAFQLTAQTNEGAIAGVVTDSSGAAVAGASVTARNTQRGTSSTTVTSSEGSYRFPSLPLGTYDMTVTLTGFQTVTQTGVVVQVSTTTAANITLPLGAVTESVTVKSEGTTVQSESSDIGTVIDTRQQLELPLALGGVGAMRSPEAFVFLAPGTAGPGTANSNNGIFISKIGAGQNFGNEVLLDGLSTLRNENGSSFDEAAPSVESIREFRVITSTLPTEYDHTTGGVESFTLKSGTNTIHGTAYDIFRNEDLNANNWFNNHYLLTCAPGDSACRDRYQRPLDRKNDYGTNLGGPVWIPKVYNGRDKTFFFFNWEQYHQNQGSSSTSSVPTSAIRNGDFSSLLTSNVVGTNPCDGSPIFQGQIFDPATQKIGPTGVPCRTAFPGNIIPQNRISQVAKNYLAFLPTPNGSGTVQNYTLSTATPVDNTSYQIRIDHNFTEKARIFATYHSRENTRYAGSPVLPAPADPGGWNQDFLTHYSRFGFDYTFSPTVYNHLVLGYNRTNSQNFTAGALQGHAGTNWPQKLGLNNVAGTQFPIVNYGEGYPSLGRGNNDDNVDNGWRLLNQVTWIKGAHSLGFGVDARNQLYSTFAATTDTGVYNFSRSQTAAVPTLNTTSGNGFASFLLGQVNEADRTVFIHTARWTQPYFAVYVKDDWKVRPNLTLNLGLRWNLDIPRSESVNATSNFSPTTPNPGAGGRPGAVIFGTNCNCNTKWADTYYKAFAPRLGFAWSPTRFNNRLVVRGGYSIYYSPLQYTDFGGRNQVGYSINPSFASTDNFTPAFNWDNGFPAHSIQPNLDPTIKNGQNNVDYIKPSYGEPGRIQSWSLQIQKQLGSDMIATLGYVGQKSTHLRSNIQNVNNIPVSAFRLGNQLLQDVNGNNAGVPLPYPGFTGQVQQALRPYPQYQWLYTDTLQNVGQASYESLQATLERRFSAGLSLQVAFTWQKTITDADSLLPGINGGVVQVQNTDNLNLEKALSIQDVPFVFTAAYLYELPFGKGKPFLNHGVGGAVLGGWQIGGIQRYQTGAPNSFCGATGIPGWDNCIRFDRVLGQSMYSDAVRNGTFDPFVDRYWNPAAFYDPNSDAHRAPNQPFRFGTMPRVSGDARMKPYLNEDFSIIRNFRATEKVTVQLKGEMLNAFNRHIFGSPDTGYYSPTFGLVTYTVDSPRNVQIALRVNF